MLNRASNNSVLRIQGIFQQKLYMMGTELDPRPAHIALLIFCLLEEIRFEERKTSFPATLECRGIHAFAQFLAVWFYFHSVSRFT